MDRIKNLSLDQKAKLYYMALLQKGMIDRLPDDPKAAYVKDMMGKMEEGDTYEKMAAKGKKRGNLKQGTVRKRLKIKDGEKIPLSKITKAISKIKKMKNPSEKNKKYLKALNLAKTLKTTTNVREMANELGYLKENFANQKYYDLLNDLRDEGYLHRYGVTQLQLKFGLKEKDAQEIYNQYKEDLKAEQPDAYDFYMKDLNEEENYQNLPKPDRINISYTDPGFRFYGMYLHKDGKRFAKINFEDRATKYLKNLGVKTEVPRRYDENTLDKIKQEIDALGIKGDYDAAMDVS